MKVLRVVKQKFTVIGIEGSTNDGSGFINKLWDEANSSFTEIMDLCKRDENGGFVGFWGAMSDFTHSFETWEDFSKGLYLAGAVHDFTDPNSGKGYTYIPIKRLDS